VRRFIEKLEEEVEGEVRPDAAIVVDESQRCPYRHTMDDGSLRANELPTGLDDEVVHVKK
jgi:hypothetical protein